MVDTVDTITLFAGKDKYAVRLVNISDGTGESAVVKLDKSAIATALGITEPSKIIIEELYWNIQGFTSVRLYWDHDTDDEIDVLCNSGYRDFSSFGGLVDPGSAGGIGDVLLTTVGVSATATYSIFVVISFSNATI